MRAPSVPAERHSAGSRPRWWERRQVQGSALRATIHAVLLVGAAVMLLPLVWQLSSSLKDPGDIFLFPPAWIPDPVRWENYTEAMTSAPFHLFFRNTALITGLSILGRVISCSVVAFAFARLRWTGRDTLFVVMLSTLMLPHHVTLIPQFIIFRELGWIDTLLPLVVPDFFGGPFYIFLLRQFFMRIPLELDDAARIDGAGTFQIFSRIILPLSWPALAAVAIFVFQQSWNEFLGPLIYLHTRENFTLALGLRTFQDEYGTEWHYLMAAATVVMLPVILVFFLAQRYFIQGVVFTGVKG